MRVTLDTSPQTKTELTGIIFTKVLSMDDALDALNNQIS